jgi:hypothetical protein
MNRFTVFGVALLFLLFGTFAHAQEERRDDSQPQQQEEVKPKEDKAQQKEAKPEDEKSPKAEKEEQGDKAQKNESHDEGARPAGKSAHIPDDKFKANFGRQHTFKMTTVVHTTTVVAGQTRFVSGGYTFVILNPWPAGWLFTDECYIDYINGDYFLLDVLHPGIQVALFVVV